MTLDKGNGDKNYYMHTVHKQMYDRAHSSADAPLPVLVSIQLDKGGERPLFFLQ